MLTGKSVFTFIQNTRICLLTYLHICLRWIGQCNVLMYLQVMRIRALELSQQVRISIEREGKLNRIRVQGPPRNAMLASEQVRNILQEVLTMKHKEVIGKLVGSLFTLHDKNWYDQCSCIT